MLGVQLENGTILDPSVNQFGYTDPIIHPEHEHYKRYKPMK